MQKVDSSGTRNYVCDGASVASTVLSDGAAVYSDGSERRSGVSSFRHTDALGSTRGITNSSQTATDGILLDAFGMTVSRTGSTPTPFGFVGSEQYQSDADSGLMLLGHRYYDPSIGRFITSDPAQDGTNWYAYCGNDPLGGTDPEGLSWWAVGAGVVVGAGTTLLTGNPVAGMAAGFATATFVSAAIEHNELGGEHGAVMDGCYAALIVPAVVDTIGMINWKWGGGGCGPGGPCFAAGTPVRMADGSTKPIENVKVGDLVATRDPAEGGHGSSAAKGKSAAQKVVRTFVHHHAATLALHLDSGEAIRATPQHPFYVEGKGFVPAGQLAIGTSIVTRAGPSAKIVGIEAAGEATVYNFEVAETHTYFVGATSGGLWVHNDCIAPEEPPVNGRGEPYPQYPDPRTGVTIPCPSDPVKIPGPSPGWTKGMSGDYIKDWIDRGYPVPDGGWGNYDMHHILPRAYGGDNDFWNIVPLPRELVHPEYTKWWRGM